MTEETRTTMSKAMRRLNFIDGWFENLRGAESFDGRK
jgi:hypothetical protein